MQLRRAESKALQRASRQVPVYFEEKEDGHSAHRNRRQRVQVRQETARKRAAEIVLATCSHYLDKDGVRRELTNDLQSKIVSDVIEEFARGALRTICLAYKDLKEGDGGLTHEDDDENPVFKVVEKFGLIISLVFKLHCLILWLCIQ